MLKYKYNPEQYRNKNIIYIRVTCGHGFSLVTPDDGRLGGVVVSVLATGPKGCGFITRPRRWIFKGDKDPQHTFLLDGK
jgi:hypothetical protein